MEDPIIHLLLTEPMGRLGLVIWLVSVIGSIVSHDPVRIHAEAWARRNVPWLAGADDATVTAFVDDMLEEGDEAMLVFEKGDDHGHKRDH